MRPAFNLDSGKVLLASAAVGGKQAPDGGVMGAIPANETGEWKLTLLDESRDGFAAECSYDTLRPGSAFALDYSGAQTGENEYVSALLCDASGAPVFYGSGTELTEESSRSGTAVFVLPSDVPDGSYTLKVFNEQKNGDRLSDVAGNVAAFPLTVSRSAIMPSVALEGWVYGEEASEPVVTGNDGGGIVTFSYKALGEPDTAYSEVVPVNAGSYTVRAEIGVTANYNAGSATADFTISRRPVTVTADDKLWIIGTPEPALTASVTGLVGDDTLSYTLSRSPGREEGTYDITPAGAEIQGSYTVTFASGTLTAVAAALTGSLSGTSIQYTVQNAPADAMLIAARYDGGEMTYVRTISAIDPAGTIPMQGSGTAYRLMLLDGTTFAPLCPAWVESE